MENCIFCAIAEKKISANLVLENETCLAFLDNNPVSPYHTLVIPKVHYENMFDIPKAVLMEVTETIHQVCLLYAEKLGIDSIQIFNNSGPHTAQTVYHLHFHILPRFEKDAIRFEVNIRRDLVEKFPEMLTRLK
ncbi:MAG: HIT domain-containing protein [Anaerolineaceae bacterium]|jgi:histidine triad (HIT) family protein|nr:HIT domain-containing protein [Anaerolineaceae bacterium]